MDPQNINLTYEDLYKAAAAEVHARVAEILQLKAALQRAVAELEALRVPEREQKGE